MKIHNGKTIKLKTTKGLLKKYLKKAGVNKTRTNVLEIRTVFLTILGDYFDGKVSVDDLSSMSSRLHFNIVKPAWFADKDITLGKTMYEASEASWYKTKDPKKFKNMEKTLKDYFEENKKLLED